MKSGSPMDSLGALVGNVEQFPVLRDRIFLNHAGVTVLPRVATDALRRYADLAETDVYMAPGWYDCLCRVRAAAARLINAAPDEIALVKNTGEGLSQVAFGLDWRPGDAVVTTAVEYPANMYPWMEVARLHGVKLVVVEPDRQGDVVTISTQKLIDAIRQPGVRLCAISSVQFSTAQRMDLVAIGAACRDAGVRFCVDVIQSVGVVPVDVQAMHIDFAAADGHKWMLAPEGLGFLYVRRELLDELRPLSVGALSVRNWADFDTYDFTLRPDARRFECGSPNVACAMALAASLELIESVGVDAISQRVRRLGDQILDGAARKGWRPACPRGENLWSGSVALVSDKHLPKDVMQMLRKEHRVETSVRGGRLRASPHFYNTEEQIERFVDALPA
jgi:selenocysteine lyase/cysteine desulfurase